MKIKRIIAALIAIAAAFTLSGCKKDEAPAAPQEEATAAQTPEATENPRQTGVGFYFDTVVTLTLIYPEYGLMDSIWQECSRLENMLSKTIDGSDVWKINHSGGESVAVSPETYNILECAKKVSADTGGAFSITLAPVIALWNFHNEDDGEVPPKEAIDAALQLVDDEKLILNNDGTVALPEGMSIDLGGIAKGYIADRISSMVQGKCLGAILNFGGNVYVTGEKENGSDFIVGIEDPQNRSQALMAIHAKDTSVVTSGTYQRFFIKDGVKYHHILSKDTGMPADTDLDSATVISPVSMMDDAYATAMIVLGSEGAAKLAERLKLPTILINKNDEITTVGIPEDMFSK